MEENLKVIYQQFVCFLKKELWPSPDLKCLLNSKETFKPQDLY